MKKTLQKQKPQKRKDWFDGKFRKEIDKKRQLRIRYMESGKQEDVERYKEQRRICRENKRKAHNGNVLEMEANYKQKNIKIFYRAIKETKQGHKPKRIFNKDENGKFMTGREEILQKWKQYFEGLMNGNGAKRRRKTNSGQ